LKQVRWCLTFVELYISYHVSAGMIPIIANR